LNNDLGGLFFCFQKENAEMENIKNIKQVTSVLDLNNYAKGTVVELPEFAEGQPLIVRIKRPSILSLAKSGKIPNNLLLTAAELFTKGGQGIDVDNENMLSDMYNLCRVMAEASLVEPTLADIEGAGLELTDEQLMAIFNYSQTGVNALKPFREQ
jgi:hypothetical protein